MSWIQYFVGVSHFAECREKAAGECMKYANESPKIPYSAMVREAEKWYAICTRYRTTTKN